MEFLKPMVMGAAYDGMVGDRKTGYVHLSRASPACQELYRRVMAGEVHFGDSNVVDCMEEEYGSQLPAGLWRQLERVSNLAFGVDPETYRLVACEYEHQAVLGKGYWRPRYEAMLAARDGQRRRKVGGSSAAAVGRKQAAGSADTGVAGVAGDRPSAAASATGSVSGSRSAGPGIPSGGRGSAATGTLRPGFLTASAPVGTASKYVGPPTLEEQGGDGAADDWEAFDARGAARQGQEEEEGQEMVELKPLVRGATTGLAKEGLRPGWQLGGQGRAGNGDAHGGGGGAAGRGGWAPERKAAEAGDEGGKAQARTKVSELSHFNCVYALLRTESQRHRGRSRGHSGKGFPTAFRQACAVPVVD